eukprot:m.122380 g.122380  ORF g.122380 m.122380 type:complete len:273 (+) comp28917_c0_seq3:405-1223(+)
MKWLLLLPFLIIIGITVVLLTRLEEYDCEEDVPFSEWAVEEGAECTGFPCGCGTISQIRTCPVLPCRNAICVGGTVERRDQKCCVGVINGTYGDWLLPKCDAKCGQGFMSQKRTCEGARCGGKCEGPSLKQGTTQCNAGPCDVDMIRVTAPQTLKMVFDFRASENKQLVVLEVFDFTDVANHKALLALTIQSSSYRLVANSFQTATGVAFIAVECGDMVEACVSVGLVASKIPQLWKVKAGVLQRYDMDAFVKHGKLELDTNHIAVVDNPMS